MKKITRFLVPLAVLSGASLLLDAIGLLSPSAQCWVFSPVVALGALPLVFEILEAAKKGKADLGIPVFATLGILLYVGEFWIAAMFVFLILAGKIFKEYILWRVRESVKEISKSLPDTAFIKKKYGLQEIKIAALAVGDVVAVKAGGRIPVDGRLLSAEAAVDESVISGESKLQHKKAGDPLLAGAISQSGYLEMEATNTSANSTLAQIHRLVDEAQSRSTELSRFTTQFALGNALVALVGTVGVYWATGDLLKALAFWIALVPVIFAVIVPVATTIGIAVLAKRGVMVKSAEALENLTKIDSAVFDKTGTLTKGMPEIRTIRVVGGQYSESEFLRLVASVERYSEHPLARPIVRAAENKGLLTAPVERVEVVKGRGIAGQCEGIRIAIGNRSFMEEADVSVPEALTLETEKQEIEGATPLFAAFDGQLAGLIFVADLLREGIGTTLQRLSKQGLKLTMLTGDHEKVAAKVAETLGLTRYFAGLLPGDKIKYIQQFKDQGEKVLMTGDGINDAPALSEANIGVAMGLRGVDITLDAAEVVLLKDDIGALPGVLTTARRVFRIVRFNLAISTIIHIFAAGLSLAGVIGVVGSALVHQFSSVFVLTNTMRLFRLRD